MNDRRKLTRNELIKARRKRELRVKFTLATMIAVVILSISGLFFGLKSIASDGTEVEYYKYFKTVMVTDDETLFDLADRYANSEMTSVDNYIQEVLFINNIDSSETPISGKYIIIPYYDTLHS